MDGSKSAVDVAREMGIAHPSTEAVHAIERGSIGEAAAGAGAFVLALLGLIGLLPIALCSIAVIAAGVAMLLGGASIVARGSDWAGMPQSQKVVLGGMELVAFGGVAALVLGILALLQVASITLLAVAPIVLGCALLAQSSAVYRLESLTERRAQATSRPEQVLRAAGGTDVLIGVGAFVLGILALSGFTPVTLSLVATLAVGCALIFSGSSLAARIFGIFR